MSLKNKDRNILNGLLWYSSGLNIRELSSSSQTKSNYFGIGGVNIFSTLLLFLIGTWSFNIAFPMVFFPICLLFGLTISVFIFIFNRHTINALSVSHSAEKTQRNGLTTLPIILFAVFMGVVISTPIKFYLFEIPFSPGLLIRLSELDKFSDSNISTKISSWSITLVIILVALLPTLIKSYTLSGNSQKKRSSLINEMMWFCSGANKEILRRCPNDYSKYFGIGGTILFTSLMATLSGGYAFYTAFDSSGIAICFGLFWGAMIFNLDRFIVNTMYSDGKHSISTEELVGGLPRIIIAIFLGIVISYPLELKLFEDQVNARVETMKVDQLKRGSTGIAIAFSGIESNNLEVKDLENKKTNLQNETDLAMSDYLKVKQISRTKIDENGNRIVYYIYPEEYYVKKQNYEEVKLRNQLDIDRIMIKINGIETKIKEQEKVKGGYVESNNKSIIALSDLSARMEAFSLLKDEKPTVAIASLFIMILLVIIEISPVLFKMMIAKGDYDVILSSERNFVEVTELVRISQKNDWANTEILKVVEENKKRIAEKQYELATELNSSQELLRSIAQAQSEIAQIAIEKWKQKEIEKAIENPESFVQTGSTANQSV